MSSKGNAFTGEWRNDQKCVKGTCKYANGDEYNEEWKAGKKEGKGVEISSECNIYTEEWRNDLKCGKKTCKYAAGDEYN